MKVSHEFKTGRGQAVALHSLAVPDIALGVLGIVLAASFGWPSEIAGDPRTMILGFLLFIAVAQLVLRLPALAVIMSWTWRLADNAEKQGRLPVSTRWAWLGYVIPVVAFWMPLRILWSLNSRQGPLAGWQAMLLVAWWLLRLMTCTTGVLVLLIALLIPAVWGLHGDMAQDDSEGLGINWMALALIFGIFARAMESAVIILTHRRQPKPGEMVAATVF